MSATLACPRDSLAAPPDQWMSEQLAARNSRHAHTHGAASRIARAQH